MTSFFNFLLDFNTFQNPYLIFLIFQSCSSDVDKLNNGTKCRAGGFLLNTLNLSSDLKKKYLQPLSLGFLKNPRICLDAS